MSTGQRVCIICVPIPGPMQAARHCGDCKLLHWHGAHAHLPVAARNTAVLQESALPSAGQTYGIEADSASSLLAITAAFGNTGCWHR